MFERIDPKLIRSAEALPVAAGGDRPGERLDQREGRRSRARMRSAESLDNTERSEEMLARLAAATADIRRLQREPEPATVAATPDVRAVAAQIARDGAAALAAQAVLGAAGVRMVLDFGDAEAIPPDGPK